MYAGVIPPDEPSVAALLAAGVDVVTFSGDKLFGGPQCGVAVGKKDYIRLMGADNLYRALRPGKETYALLGAVVDAYLAGRPDEIPTYRLLRRRPEEVRALAGEVAEVFRGWPEFRCDVVADEALVGGGTLPRLTLPTFAAQVSRAGTTPRGFAATLRKLSPPVIGRVADDGVRLDARSLLEEDIPLIRRAVAPLTSGAA